MSARFLAVYPRAPGSKAWANAVATVTKCTLLCLYAYSSAVHAADWTVSGIVGTGNRVNLTGVEAQAASGFGGTLASPSATVGNTASGSGYSTSTTGAIKEPNDGVTFGELRISYRWD